MASVNKVLSEFISQNNSGRTLTVTKVYQRKKEIILHFKFSGNDTEYNVKFRVENSEEDFSISRTWKEILENNKLELWQELPQFRSKSLVGGISGDIIREEYKYVIRKIGVEDFIREKFNWIVDSRLYPKLVEDIIQPLIDSGEIVGIYRHLLQDEKDRYYKGGISSVEIREKKSAIKRKLKAPMRRTWKEFGKDPRKKSRRKAPLDFSSLNEAIAFANAYLDMENKKVRYYPTKKK